MFLSETKSGISEHHLSLRPPYLYFLLSDTVSSASLHRLTESWDWVQSMLRITRRRTMERPITMADPLRIWSWEPNKVCFQTALESHVFRVKQVFLITELSGQGKAESIKREPMKYISTGSKTLSDHHIKFITLWLFQGYFSIITLT